MKHFLSLKELTRKDLLELIRLTIELKNDQSNILKGRSVCLFFLKPSLRTRIGFELAAKQLGAATSTVFPHQTHNHRGESIKDTLKALETYADFLVVRTYEYEVLKEISEEIKVPIINALTNENHPTQIIADLVTIIEREGTYEKNILFIGQPDNNIFCSLKSVQNQLSLGLKHTCPNEMKKEGSHIDFHKGIAWADIIYTDAFYTMQDEQEKEMKEVLFREYQLTEKNTDGKLVMHCMPRHEEIELTDNLAYGPNSLMLQQAENKLHAAKAILTWVSK